MTYRDQKRYRNEYRKYKHSTQTVKMQRPSTGFVHQRHGDQRHVDHNDTDADGHELGVVLGQTSGHEQTSRIIEHL